MTAGCSAGRTARHHIPTRAPAGSSGQPGKPAYRKSTCTTCATLTPPRAATPESTGRRYPKRIGHADVAFTMKQYVQTDLEADREVANTLADLIVGGLLVTDAVNGQADDDQGDEAETDEGPA